jgi:hypothetical protein
MNLAREINEKLDEILAIRAEIKRMKKDLSNSADLINIITGKPCSKREALKVVDGVLDGVKDDLNKITNNGNNIRDVFNNQFYVNDLMEDKRVAKPQIKKFQKKKKAPNNNKKDFDK